MAKIRVKYGPEGAPFRIGGLLFQDGVAEVDELTPSDREIIAMLGAEVESDEPVSDTDHALAAGPAEPSDDAKDAVAHEIVTTDSEPSGDATLEVGTDEHGEHQADA